MPNSCLILSARFETHDLSSRWRLRRSCRSFSVRLLIKHLTYIDNLVPTESHPLPWIEVIDGIHKPFAHQPVQ